MVHISHNPKGYISYCHGIPSVVHPYSDTYSTTGANICMKEKHECYISMILKFYKNPTSQNTTPFFKFKLFHTTMYPIMKSSSTSSYWVCIKRNTICAVCGSGIAYTSEAPVCSSPLLVAYVLLDL